MIGTKSVNMEARLLLLTELVPAVPLRNSKSQSFGQDIKRDPLLKSVRGLCASSICHDQIWIVMIIKHIYGVMKYLVQN